VFPHAGRESAVVSSTEVWLVRLWWTGQQKLFYEQGIIHDINNGQRTKSNTQMVKILPMFIFCKTKQESKKELVKNYEILVTFFRAQ
jgi:hypothetical protein